MSTIAQKLIRYFANKPAALFMVDSFGVALTSLSLYIISRNFTENFGLPGYILTYLSLIALVLCIYSAVCFFFLKDHCTPFLKTIALGNFFYCMLTLLLMFRFFNELTLLGLTYFFAEIIIILALIYLELMLARRLKK